MLILAVFELNAVLDKIAVFGLFALFGKSAG